MVAGIFVTFGRRYGPPSGQPALPYLAATGLAEELHVKKLLLYAAPLAAIDGHRWLPQLFHHPGRKYCLVRYRSLGQGWNNQHAANRASPATRIAFSKATLLSVNKVLTCVNGDRIVHGRQTRNFFVGSSIGNQMFAPALSLVGHTCSI